MEWVPIAHSSQHYPPDLDERACASPHPVAPAVRNKSHFCKIDNDIRLGQQIADQHPLQDVETGSEDKEKNAKAKNAKVKKKAKDNDKSKPSKVSGPFWQKFPQTVSKNDSLSQIDYERQLLCGPYFGLSQINYEQHPHSQCSQYAPQSNCRPLQDSHQRPRRALPSLWRVRKTKSRVKHQNTGFNSQGEQDQREILANISQQTR
ncbi:hypothetical protein F5Y05DRAFT_425101 [Hypoxylon sp. FL0543]|nr:hypothetical protein F5Y05DRAFT_425101 [Hypoxylon sp. FL0543]